MRSMERLHIATGLTALIQGNYLKAATSFLRVSREAGQYVGAEVVSDKQVSYPSLELTLIKCMVMDPIRWSLLLTSQCTRRCVLWPHSLDPN